EQGQPWDAPATWGARPEEAIRKDDPPATYVSYFSTLGMGTSEDVIQFVYDWFMSGDFHSRDAARLYKDAFVKEMNFDVEKFLKIFPTYVLLRPMGIAYELDRDPRLYDYGHKVLQRVVG